MRFIFLQVSERACVVVLRDGDGDVGFVRLNSY